MRKFQPDHFPVGGVVGDRFRLLHLPGDCGDRLGSLGWRHQFASIAAILLDYFMQVKTAQRLSRTGIGRSAAFPLSKKKHLVMAGFVSLVSVCSISSYLSYFESSMLLILHDMIRIFAIIAPSQPNNKKL